MKNRLWEMTWEEVKEAVEVSNGIIIIPVGSTEQHGRHLPLGTDTMVAISLADEASKRTETVMAPPVWTGWSPHHMVLPGTITIRPQILIELLFDIISSLSKHGFARFIVINGHRIVNIPWMQIAAQSAQEKLGVKVKLFDPAYMSKEIVKELGWGLIGHGEEIETSHMMVIHPDLVYEEKMVDAPQKETPLYWVDPRVEFDTLCYVPSTLEIMKEHAEKSGGISGKTKGASYDKGKRYHEHLIKRLIEVIKGLK